jgi:AcrR family transcriptional regulator
MRQALLDAAMALIAERGLYATRIEDITERADLGKGAFYNYFDSKEALIAELVLQGVELLGKHHLVRPEAAVGLPARVNSVLQAHGAFLGERPDYALLFHQARGLLEMNPRKAEALHRAFTSYLERIAEIVVPADRQDRHNSRARMDLAAVVAGMIFGYRSFCRAAGFNPNPKTLARVVAKGFTVVA